MLGFCFFVFCLKEWFYSFSKLFESFAFILELSSLYVCLYRSWKFQVYARIKVSHISYRQHITWLCQFTFENQTGENEAIAKFNNELGFWKYLDDVLKNNQFLNAGKLFKSFENVLLKIEYFRFLGFCPKNCLFIEYANVLIWDIYIKRFFLHLVF